MSNEQIPKAVARNQLPGRDQERLPALGAGRQAALFAAAAWLVRGRKQAQPTRAGVRGGRLASGPPASQWARVRRPRVLVVDDHPLNISLLEAYLVAVDCDVAVAESGAAALEIIHNLPCDLVLLDVQMPGLDGLQVCRQLKSDMRTRLVPVVMVTALNATADRIRALDAGADDFLVKPVDRLELLARVTSLLRLRAAYDRLEDTERVIFALARAVEAKDRYTEAHTSRVASTARALGALMGATGHELDDIYWGGAIHDIGKIGIPDAILLKPGPLTAQEMAVMRTHPALGEEIARPLSGAAGLLSIIRHHHEAVDGSGYPDGLRGSEIPLGARIVSICDAYDALISDRPYRRGKSQAEAIGVLNEGAGRQWDAALVELFTIRVLQVAVHLARLPAALPLLQAR